MVARHKVAEEVGVVVVHGIGEQRRFEHLDGQTRELVDALRARPNATVTVTIRRVGFSAFEAEQDTWSDSRTVLVDVLDGPANKPLCIAIHEVWWGDVNEPYSLGKQLRFWLWSLSIWLYPNKRESILATTVSVRAPLVPGGSPTARELWVRARLFGIGFVAVLFAASIGMVSFLAERVFKIRMPRIVQLFVNYVAGVKLYNQKRRFGAGFPAREQDFLDTISEPPRVSVRRRMIETLLRTAECRYSRWYVLAHSLGSVIAFNGLMETAYAWPGYLTAGDVREPTPQHPAFLGPANPGWTVPPGHVVPARPVWAEPDLIAYRSRIFGSFHGLITFGCPLEKFAAIWPARVPISMEPALRAGTFWLNVYDPVDPVSGVLRSFAGSPTACCPTPVNFGYAASPWLLVSHIRYLAGPHGSGTLADGMAELLVTGSTARIGLTAGTRWFSPNSARHRQRTGLAWVSWIVAVFLLTGLGIVVLPPFLTAIGKASAAIWRNVVPHVALTAADVKKASPGETFKGP